MSKILLPLKLYEVQSGNVEHYLWDQDFYVIGNKIEQATSGYNETPEGAKSEIDGETVTQFYAGNPTGIGMNGFGPVVDVTPFLNKTIRAYLKNDSAGRMIEFHFTGSLPGYIRPEYRFFLNGVQKFIFDNTGQIYYNSEQTQSRTSCIPFPIKYNGGYYEQFSNCFGWHNVYDAPFFFCQMSQYSAGVGSGVGQAIDEWMNGYEPYYPDDDNPYDEGGRSSEDKGNANFSDDSDSISDEGLPSLSAVGTGFATIFTPSATQLHNLSAVMWNQTVFGALQNLVENITDMFTGLSIVPFNVTAGRTVTVTWLGLFDTGIDLTLAANQFYDIPMGSIDLSADGRIFTSGSALDYAPFSKLGIYLPFIGFQELDVDECRNAVISLHYKVDILSGTCVAMISLDGNEIYQFTGNCLTQIPITNQSLESLVSDAVQVGIAISNTGATAATAAGDIAESAGSEDGLQYQDVATAHQRITRSEGQLASATANAMMGMKPTIKKSGAVSAAASLMSIRQPYLFLTTPRQSMPYHYQKYCGFPSNITGKLNTFSGFTQVESIRLNHLVATSPEIAEIYDLLKKGVII